MGYKPFLQTSVLLSILLSLLGFRISFGLLLSRKFQNFLPFYLVFLFLWRLYLILLSRHRHRLSVLRLVQVVLVFSLRYALLVQLGLVTRSVPLVVLRVQLYFLSHLGLVLVVLGLSVQVLGMHRRGVADIAHFLSCINYDFTGCGTEVLFMRRNTSETFGREILGFSSGKAGICVYK